MIRLDVGEGQTDRACTVQPCGRSRPRRRILAADGVGARSPDCDAQARALSATGPGPRTISPVDWPAKVHHAITIQHVHRSNGGDDRAQCDSGTRTTWRAWGRARGRPRLSGRRTQRARRLAARGARRNPQRRLACGSGAQQLCPSRCGTRGSSNRSHHVRTPAPRTCRARCVGVRARWRRLRVVPIRVSV